MLMRAAIMALASLMLSGCAGFFAQHFPFDAEEQARIRQRLEQEPLIKSVVTDTVSGAGGLTHELRVTVRGAPDQSLDDARATVEQARTALTDALRNHGGRGWVLVFVQELGDAEGRVQFLADVDRKIEDGLPLIDAMYEEIGRGASRFGGKWPGQRQCESQVGGPAEEAVPILYADWPSACETMHRRRRSPSNETFHVPPDRPISATTIKALDDLYDQPVRMINLGSDGLLRIELSVGIPAEKFDGEAARILAKAAKIEEFDRVSIGKVGAFDTSSGITPQNPDDERAARIAEAANG